MNDRPTRHLDQRWANAAIILIAVGVVFLLGELFNFRVGGWLWPFFILVPGAFLLAAAFRGDRVSTGPAVPGAVLTMLGLIFLYQEITGHWESWAYIWALLPFAVGLALYVAGSRNDDPESVETGRRMMRIFGAIFVIGLVFFELLIFDRGGFAGYFLPIVLIVAGGAILWIYYQQHGTLPWNSFGPPPESPASAPATPPQPASPPPAPATPSTAPPPRAAVAPPPASEHFPEDELPHEPSPDDAPFPEDEEAPHDSPAAAPPPAAEPSPAAEPLPAPKPRRRRTTTRKTSASPTTDTPDNQDNSS